MDVVVDIVVALTALAALIVVILANRNVSRSADASQEAREAKRSADAAERQAAAEAALPPPPPAVAWKAELRSSIARKGGSAAFTLRNIGTSTAAGVRVVVPHAYDGLVRSELGDGEVPAHGSFQVLVLGIDQLPVR